MADGTRGGSADSALDLIVTDEIVSGDFTAGQKIQVVKLATGADGVASMIGAANPLPISAASLPLPSGAATQATLASILTALGTPLQAGPVALDAAALSALESITVTLDAGSLAALESITTVGPLTDGQLRASAVPVSAAALPLPTGAATETTLAAVVAALGATLTVDGTVTLDAGSLSALETITVGLDADSLAALESITATGPLTDAQLRAVAVPVSGPATDAQLRATALPVSGTFFQATQPVSAASLPLPTGASTNSKLDEVVTAIEGIAAGGDATAANQTTQIGHLAAIETAVEGTLTVDGTVELGATSLAALETVAVTGPLTDAQLRATAVPVSGTVAVTGSATAANQSTEITHLSTIAGAVRAEDSIHANADAGLATLARRADTAASSTATDGDYGVLNTDSAGRLRVTQADVTQPVSGTVTVTGVATETTLAAASAKLPATLGQKSQANSFPVTLASDDFPLIVAGGVTIAGPVVIDDDGGSITVDAPVATPVFVRLSDGTSAIATLPVSGPLTDAQLRATAVPVSGTVAVTGSATAANQSTIIGHVDGIEGLLTTIDADTSRIPAVGQAAMAASVPVAIASNQSAVPVSGTVTANAGTGTQAVSLAALPALVAGTANIGDVDIASLPGTVAADIAAIKVAVEVIDNAISGAEMQVDIVSGGSSGVQYTEGDTDATITGNAVMWEDAANTLVAASAAKPLPIGDAGGSLTVDGTVGVSGTVAVTQSGTWDEVGINDSGNSITVDNAVLSVVGTGTEATAQRVTIATDSTGVLSVDDNGSSLTVDGTVTANAGSGTMAVSLATLPALVAGSANIGDVDVLSIVPGTAAANLGKAEDAAHATGDVGVMALAVRQDSQADFGADGDYVPLSIDADGALRVTGGSGGDASAANQATQTGILTTIDADTGAIMTAVQLIDNAIAGSEMQVDVVAALPAGTNNIGDVDVLTVPADPFGANADASSSAGGTGSMSAKLRLMTLQLSTAASSLGKVVDAAAGSTDTVVAAGAVRDDALATLTPVDGDYVSLRTGSTGALWVQPVDGVVPLSGASNLGKAVDAVAGAGDTGVAILAVRDDSLTTLTPADGDYVPLRTDASGALHVNAGAGAAQYSEDAAHASGDAGDFILAIRTDTPASSAATTGDYAGITTDINGRLWTASAAPTGTLSNVNDSASNVTLLAANASRRGASFYNDSTQVLYLKWGATASVTSFTTKVQPDQLYELPGPTVYTGIVDGIWAADGSGACRVTELT